VGLRKLLEKVETRSGNAHHVILSYNRTVFYVSTVRVHFCRGDTRHRAVFCAKEAKDGPSKDLAMEIPQNLYEVLLKYVHLNNPDLILVLQVEDGEFKWGFISETWLKQYSSRDNFRRYVV
jgi:hypothetical protein